MKKISQKIIDQYIGFKRKKVTKKNVRGPVQGSKHTRNLAVVYCLSSKIQCHVKLQFHLEFFSPSVFQGVCSTWVSIPTHAASCKPPGSLRTAQSCCLRGAGPARRETCTPSDCWVFPVFSFSRSTYSQSHFLVFLPLCTFPRVAYDQKKMSI